MRYRLDTTSKVTGQRCYFDGYGFTLKKSNARLFKSTGHSGAEEHAEQVSGLFNGHDVRFVEVKDPRYR